MLDGLTNTYVTALVVVPNGNVFAGTFGGGVFRSANDGDHSDPVNNGLTESRSSPTANAER